VPKGPSLDPSEKRLAVRVEDHPLQYGEFEGVIPPGEYGAGTVMIWDRGTWSPAEASAPGESLRGGELKFDLAGQKLRGRFVLVRLRDGLTGSESRDWLLIKEKDDEVRAARGGDILVEQPLSVASGRGLDEIAAQPEEIWDMERARAEKRGRARHRAAERADVADLIGAEPGELPDRVEPQLASLSRVAPEGGEWLHEIKYDGYRFACRIDGDDVRFLTRNGHDWTDRLASLVEAAVELPVERAMLDGEIVFLEPTGTTNFQALQNSIRSGRTGSLVYYVFDLLHLDGIDLRRVPLESRKSVLSELVAPDRGRIRYSDHLVGHGPEFLRQAAKLSLEGIIAKRRDRPYRSTRSADWLKIKCVERQEFVVGGYTLPAGMRSGIGALGLEYVGRVGTGFTEASLEDLRHRLDAIALESSPFADDERALRKIGARFARPELVANVEFTGWTESGHLRHPTFRGLREDVDPAVVVREDAAEARASETDATPDVPDRALDALRGFYMTHPDRLFWPELGITKLTLASTFAQIVDWVLPHLTDRPLSLLRHPEGWHAEGFFQKHRSEGMPEGVRWTVLEDEGEEVLFIEDVVGLMGLVQMGVLEIHPWGARVDRPDRPDRCWFDLDPDPEVPWSRVVDAARLVHDQLERLGLESFVKTTGGKGLHVVVPLARRHGWKEVKAFSRAVARRIAAASPSAFTLSPSKRERTGRIYIDTARNGRGATAVGPYSPRARAGAPMSVPIGWDELSPGVRSDHFTVANLPRRIASVGEDPWAGLDRVTQSITARVRSALGL